MRSDFLSIFMQVERHREIVCAYQDLQGERKEFRAGEERDLVELLQHEIDHLDGILAGGSYYGYSGTMCTREELRRDIGRGVLTRWCDEE